MCCSCYSYNEFLLLFSGGRVGFGGGAGSTTYIRACQLWWANQLQINRNDPPTLRNLIRLFPFFKKRLLVTSFKFSFWTGVYSDCECLAVAWATPICLKAAPNPLLAWLPTMCDKGTRKLRQSIQQHKGQGKRHAKIQHAQSRVMQNDKAFASPKFPKPRGFSICPPNVAKKHAQNQRKSCIFDNVPRLKQVLRCKESKKK